MQLSVLLVLGVMPERVLGWEGAIGMHEMCGGMSGIGADLLMSL